MKKWMIGSLVLIAFMVVAAGVYAQSADKQKKQNKTECVFVDKNKDGKCDICGSTAEACKKECKAAKNNEGEKCSDAASCAGNKNEAVPAEEGTSNTTPGCPNKK
jgi:hypothetical protein